jgi:hypothetical protein
MPAENRRFQGRLAQARSPAELRAAFAISVWSTIALIAVVLISRRVEGAYTSPSGALLPCVTASLASLFSLVAQFLWNGENASMPSRRGQIVAAAVTVIAPLGIGAALWNFDSIAAGGYLIALATMTCVAAAVIATDGFVQSGVNQTGKAARAANATPWAPEDIGEMASVTGVLKATSPPIDDEEPDKGDSSLLQSITRRLLPDGRETVEGAVRIHFVQGEKVAVAHVAFVPPLSSRPQAECNPLTDFGGRARVAVAQSYGLRIEARRTDDTSDATVDVAFSAQVSHSQATAA